MAGGFESFATVQEIDILPKKDVNFCLFLGYLVEDRKKALAKIGTERA